MSLQLMLRDEYRKGKAEGRVEDILDLLEDLGPIPEKLEQTIREETDMALLKSMLKAAAKAKSLEQFAEAISQNKTAPSAD